MNPIQFFANSFLQTPWFWFLGLLLPVIVIFYLLKLKRKRVMIPSTLLWRRSVQDLIANSPFQKLRNNLLMWLQLLLLLALIVAFMRPVAKLENLGGQTVIFLIDNSASMQTVEPDGRTRLTRAKEAARDALDTLSNRDEAIVITFSDRTDIVQTMTSDKSALSTAITNINAHDTETTLDEAGLILQGLTTVGRADGGREPRENTKTIILSDGAISELDSLADVPNIEYVRIGEEVAENLGISGIDVRESFTGAFEYQVFASITNSSAEEREVFVEFRVGDQVIDLASATVPAMGSNGVVFRTGEVFDDVATISLDSDDDFPLDDQVQALISPPDTIDVLLVSDGNDFLQAALMVDPRVEISITRPTDYTVRDDYDLVVFDGVTTSDLPPGNFVFLNALPPASGFDVEGERINNPSVIDWNRVHPLTRYVNFDSLLIGSALDMQTPPEAVTILEALDTPLITLYQSETQRIVVVGFDVFDSVWPLDVSFVIFWSNVLDTFSREGRGIYQPVYHTGTTIPIYPERETTSATVTRPDGRTLDFSFDGIATAYLTDTFVAGLYQVDFDEGRDLVLPVNLLSEAESLIESAESIQVGGNTFVGSEEVVRTNQEIWHWFVLFALGVLLVEWLIYTRRTFM